VAFRSASNNLVPGDTNGSSDIFVDDRDADENGIFDEPGAIETTRVSVRSDGTEGNSYAGYYPSISDDGRFVSFDSYASNLVSGDTNNDCWNGAAWINCPDIFVHDRDTGETTRVSVATDGTQADGPSKEQAISADGLFVAFESEADNLVPHGNTWREIYVHDRTTGETTIESYVNSSVASFDICLNPTPSADGRFVAFSSEEDWVTGYANGRYDIFLRDRATGEITIESLASDGTVGSDHAGDPAISADASFVAFRSSAGEFVAGDTTQANSNSSTDWAVAGKALSADGRFMSFWSEASDLVADDTHVCSIPGRCRNPPDGPGCYNCQDIFVHDRLTGATKRVSLASDGSQGNADTEHYSISSDGHSVAFKGLSDNLVAGDTNGKSDIFVRGPDPDDTASDLTADGVR
jgi:Tol biopolymer transport system component